MVTYLALTLVSIALAFCLGWIGGADARTRQRRKAYTIRELPIARAAVTRRKAWGVWRS